MFYHLKKINFYALCSFVFLCLFSSCAFAFDGKLNSKGSAPYQISGEMLINSESSDSNTEFDFAFTNKSSKKVSSFTIVFYLFDDDGNPVMNGRSNVVANVQMIVEAHEKIKGAFSLDNYVAVIPSESYSIDFLYVSKIKYEDGSVWTDPFGIYSK